MEKPKKKDLSKSYYGNYHIDDAYNRGRSDMDTYRKQELEKKADVGRIENIIDKHAEKILCLDFGETTEEDRKSIRGLAQEISKMIKDDVGSKRTADIIQKEIDFLYSQPQRSMEKIKDLEKELVEVKGGD